jgi:disulfide bond formation protein DsbB
MSTQDVGEHTIPARGSAALTWLACLVALAASAGSVYLSVGMNLRACPLCFYQRTFAFASFGVLLVGLFTGARRAGLSLLVLPLAVAGLGVAGFHVYLEWNATLECPHGIQDIGTAPQQSLAAFALLTLILVLAILNGGVAKGTLVVALLGTAVLGGVFAAASVISSPPMPPTPTKAYAPNSLDMCRPPYRGS